MTNSPLQSNSEEARLSHRLRELRDGLAGRDPNLVADRAGIDYSPDSAVSGNFKLHLWEKEIYVSYPGYAVQDGLSRAELPHSGQALVLYYLFTADGTPPQEKWISFSELPDGRFYNQAFHGYTGLELGKVFKNDLEGLADAAILLGGVHQITSGQAIGDILYAFQAFPRLAVAVVAWEGDEEFPASYQILFDACAPHYLPTDACAILGSTLVRRLIARHKS